MVVEEVEEVEARMTRGDTKEVMLRRIGGEMKKKKESRERLSEREKTD